MHMQARAHAEYTCGRGSTSVMPALGRGRTYSSRGVGAPLRVRAPPPAGCGGPGGCLWGLGGPMSGTHTVGAVPLPRGQSPRGGPRSWEDDARGWLSKWVVAIFVDIQASAEVGGGFHQNSEGFDQIRLT